LNYENKKTIDFEKLKNMVIMYTLGDDFIETLYEKKILRDKMRNVFTANCKKDYRIIYTKCNLRENFLTFPFGYKFQ